jgi:hypothetical protein
VRPRAPRLVTPAVDALRDPDRIRVLALIAELGRVMKHENSILGRNRALTHRLKMTGENIRLARSLEKNR